MCVEITHPLMMISIRTTQNPRNHNNLSSEEQLRMVLVLYWCNLIIDCATCAIEKAFVFLFKQEWIFGYIGNLAVYSGTSNYVEIIY